MKTKKVKDPARTENGGTAGKGPVGPDDSLSCLIDMSRQLMSMQEQLLEQIQKQSVERYEGQAETADIRDNNREKQKKEYNKRAWAAELSGNIFYSSGYWMSYVRINGKRKRVKRKNREDLEKYLLALQKGLPIQKHKPKAGERTVRGIFKKWNDERLRSERVMGSTHLRDKRSFEKYFDKTELADRNMADTLPQEWADFLQDLFNEGLTVKQWGGVRLITRGIIKYSRREGIIYWNYNDVFDLLDVHFTRKKPIDESAEILYADELKSLRSYCLRHWGAHERCIWLVSYTGMRIGEAVALKPQDVALDRMTITVQRRETRGDEMGRPRICIVDGAKTSAGVRTVALPPSIMSMVRNAVEAAESEGWEYLFCGESGERLSAEAVRRRLRQIEEDEIGMEQRKPPHKLRKTVASILCDSRLLTEKQIIGQLGHTDIQTTQKFYNKDRSTVDERAEILDNIPEMGSI